MASRALSLLVAVALFASAFAASEYAHCKLVGTSADSTINGWVYFSPDPADATLIRVRAEVQGITQNVGIVHGMHVHQYGDIDPADAGSKAGGHYVGSGAGFHGCPENGGAAPNRDSGDMGNWNVTAAGTISEEKSLDLLSLSGDTSIIGRAVILHAFTDNCTTNGVPSAGARLARCVIGVGANSSFPWTTGVLTSANTASNPGSATDATKAVAYLTTTTPGAPRTITGTVFFEIVGGVLRTTATISGLTDFTHGYGLHVHEFGDLSTNDGNSVGGHYNPQNAGHGLPPNTNRHIGDLGNVCSFDNSIGYYVYDNTLAQLTSVNSIIGRAVVLHGIQDVGNTTYGPRIAQGVIGIAFTSTVAPTVSITVANPDCTTGNTTTTTTGSATTGTTTTASATTSTTGLSSTSTTGNQPSSTTSSASSLVASVFVVVAAIALAF